MRKNRKVIALLLTICLVLPLFAALSACSKGGNGAHERKEIGDLLSFDTTYTVVLPASYTATQGYAAEQICYYFRQVTGEEISYVTDTGLVLSEDSTYISLGNTGLYASAARSKKNIDLSREALNSDGFYIFTYGKNVLINSYNDRGIMYGAFEFIEDTLGVKFLTDDYTHIPQKDSVVLYEYDKTYQPAFEQRAFLNTAVFSGDTEYVAHMRYNTDYCVMPENMGGTTKWCQFGGDPAHTLPAIVKVSDYYSGKLYNGEAGKQEIKPEYVQCFAHTGGNDSTETVYYYQDSWGVLDLCYTDGLNDDGTLDEAKEISAIRLVIESLKNYIVDNPDAEYFMLGQADRPYGCPCDDCVAARSKYAASGLMIRFVNCVSDEIAKWMTLEGMERDVKLTIFAYDYDETAPVDDDKNVLDPTVVPRDNVYIKYAPIRSVYYYALDDERQNDDTRGIFSDWANVTDRMMAWTYHCYFGNWFWYYPTMQTFSDMIDMMRKVGTKYEFAQSVYLESGVIQQWVDSYVFSKLCWNPEANVTDLRNEFIRYYFGEDAYENMLQYYEEMDGRYTYLSTKSVSMRTGEAVCRAEYWQLAFMNRMVELFTSSEEATRANPALTEAEKQTYIAHLEKASLMPMWMRLYNANKYAGLTQERISELAAEWISLAEKYGVSRYGENAAFTVGALKQQYHL